MSVSDWKSIRNKFEEQLLLLSLEEHAEVSTKKVPKEKLRALG